MERQKAVFKPEQSLSEKRQRPLLETLRRQQKLVCGRERAACMKLFTAHLPKKIGVSLLSRSFGDCEISLRF